MTTVTYLHSNPFTGNRPYGDVVLCGPTGLKTTYKALVDTGADYLQLPAAAATLVHISLPAANLPVHTASGTASMTLVKSVAVDVEGISIIADVLFHPNPTTQPLLGRQALLRAVDAGFNRKEWLWTALPSSARYPATHPSGAGTSDLDDMTNEVRIGLLRRMKQLGVTDPAVDLFVAIMSNDVQLVRSSLDAGADPDSTLGAILQRHHTTCIHDPDYQELLAQLLIINQATQ